MQNGSETGWAGVDTFVTSQLAAIAAAGKKSASLHQQYTARQQKLLLLNLLLNTLLQSILIMMQYLIQVLYRLTKTALVKRYYLTTILIRLM
jgi:hypothetical protein